MGRNCRTYTKKRTPSLFELPAGDLRLLAGEGVSEEVLTELQSLSSTRLGYECGMS